MSNDHHNNNGHNENKPVAFTAPLILGSITIFIILLFVSLGNPCHGHGDEMCCEDGKECSKECMEACEKGDHSKHPAGTGHGEDPGAKHEEHYKEHANTTDTTSPTSTTDSTQHEEPVKKEEGHH